MINEYIKRVLSRWWILLGITPEILDRISTYYGHELELPSELTYSLILIFLLISTYLVWKEEKLQNIELEEKYKNPIDYDITANLYPLDLEQNDIIENEYKTLSEKKDAINGIEEELLNIDEDYEEKFSNNTNLSLFHSMDILSGRSKRRDERPYKDRFEIYKNSYLRYISDYEKYIEDLEKYYQSFESKVYYVEHIIENIGTSSDEGIYIHIKIKDGIFKKYEELFSNLPSAPNEPKKPSVVEYIDTYAQIRAVQPSIDFPYIDNEKYYRRFYKLEEKSVTVQLRDLNVGDRGNVFKDKFFLFTDDYNSMSFTIKSKNSTKVIRKDIPTKIKNKLTYNDICIEKDD
ncbi:hypothetical protein ACNSOO_06015 [Aliarcobacter lanthieri]|uniref:hypothetical protein n=1 Tax=Aliarcobacter lanthieri TaxID=1355374 RepID=UPI003AAD915E